MSKIPIFISILIAFFINIKAESPVLFKQASKASYENYMELASKSDKAALQILADAWKTNGDASKFRFIGNYLTKKGFSLNEVKQKLDALNINIPANPVNPTPVVNPPTPIVPPAPPIVPSKPPVEPNVPTAPPIGPNTPSAPPIAPNAPPITPRLSPGAVANLTEQQRNEFIKNINILLKNAHEGSTDESNLKDYLKKLKAKTLKNREKDALENIFIEIKAKQEEEEKLKKQEEELKEALKKETEHLRIKLEEKSNQELKKFEPDLKKAFANYENNKKIQEIFLNILTFDEAKKSLSNIEKRLKNTNQEAQLKLLSQDLKLKTDQLNENKKTIKSLQQEQINEDLEASELIQNVYKIKQLTQENSKLNGIIEALNNEIKPKIKSIHVALENESKVLSKIIEDIKRKLEKAIITKDDGNKLLNILNIKDPNDPILRILTSKKGSPMLTKEDLEKMQRAQGGQINRPSGPSTSTTVVSPIEVKLKELKKELDSFEHKSYAKEAAKHKALEYYNYIKENKMKHSQNQILDLIKALNKDLEILNENDAKYNQQSSRARSENAKTIFINYEETLDFL